MRIHEQAEFEAFVTVRSEPLRRTAYLIVGDWATADATASRSLAALYPRWRRLQRRDVTDAEARKAVVRAAVAQPAAEALDPRLAPLTTMQRAVLVLRLREGMSVADTAALLGSEEGLVTAVTAQGLAALGAATGDVVPAVFDQLVREPPPTTIDPRVVRDTGAMRVRRGQFALGAVAVVAGAVALVLVRPWSGSTGGPGAPVAAGGSDGAGSTARVAYLPFISPEQLAAAQTRAFQLLVAEARKHGAVLRTLPPSLHEVPDGQYSRPPYQGAVDFVVGADSARLAVQAWDPTQFDLAHDVVQSQAQHCSGPQAQARNCVRSVLPRGAVLWTLEALIPSSNLGPVPSAGTSPSLATAPAPSDGSRLGTMVLFTRYAVVFEADGSSMMLTLRELAGHSAAGAGPTSWPRSRASTTRPSAGWRWL